MVCMMGEEMDGAYYVSTHCVGGPSGRGSERRGCGPGPPLVLVLAPPIPGVLLAFHHTTVLYLFLVFFTA